MNDPIACNPGDLVMLKSGGPAMTVVDVGQHTGLVWCRWSGHTGKVVEGVFPTAALGRPNSDCRRYEPVLP